jgi:hypothetical protein
MRTQYLISVSNKKEREIFYDYIDEKYNLVNSYPYGREEFISSIFPFVVDFKEKKFWVCESITCCACAASQKRILTVKEFKKILKGGR